MHQKREMSKRVRQLRMRVGEGVTFHSLNIDHPAFEPILCIFDPIFSYATLLKN